MTDELKFESALEQLQQTVKKLESGELGLEQALKCFEEGVRLAGVCQKHLTDAETRVEQLIQATTDGKIQLQPFPPQRS